MRIEKMRVNQVEAPLGFAMNQVSFSWIVEDVRENSSKRYTQIKVKKEGELVFDSGKDVNADSVDYAVKFELQPRTRYEWSVTVETDHGEQATAHSFFETGKMDEKWQGMWITSSLEPTVSPIMAKDFMVTDAISDARIYLCGLGVYELYINEKKVGDEFLAPGYHSYDFHLQIQTYEIADYLRTGQNHIEVMLADGWFKGRLGFDGGFTNLYGDRFYLIAELHARLQNGSELIVGTDESWKCKPSPVTFSNIYDGEIYDARLEGQGDWIPVTAKEPNKCGSLSDRYSLPIVKKEERMPMEFIETPKGELVLDFGQNMTGWVEFECCLNEGDAITLTASEILQDGCFYHGNFRTAKTEFTYISNGVPAHARPHFTFFGFRYMKVECTGKLEASHFVAHHLRSDFNQSGWIETGNEKVNHLFSNALWSQKDNFLDVPTDCPQRDERLGWTGDAQIFSETACFNMYMPAFYRKYLWDMRAEQSVLDGSVPNVVPRLKEGMVAEHGACPWADAGVIIPWNTYRQYGNKTLLAETYPGMKAWVDYQRKKEEASGGPHLIKDGFHFADWLALDAEQPGPFGATDPLYIASAYYYKDVRIVADSAKVLEFEEDAEEYNVLAGEILKAIQDTYFEADGTCKCKTQTGAALAIEFGLNPVYEENEGKKLCERLKANDGHLNTGFVGTTILLPALTKTGHHDMAVELLLNEEFPGWLYAVNLGATTIWERWNSVEADGRMNEEGMNSLNHYSYGSVVAWMYRDLCGFHPVETRPGYKKAVIAPHPDARLGYAMGRLETSAGTYQSEWEVKEDGSISYRITIPFDAEAEVRLPGKSTMTLKCGTYIF